MFGITNKQVTVLVFVPDSTGYDKLCISKSIDGPYGVYFDLTSGSAGATLLSRRKENFSLSGKEFKIVVNGISYSFTFGSEQSASSVAGRINNEITTVIATAESGYVRITTKDTGLGTTLEIQESSEAGVVLGFYEGDWDVGEMDKIALVSGQKLYSFTDPNGDSTFYYKYRLYNSTTGIYSDFSIPFTAMGYGAIDPANIIFGYTKIIDSSGNPVANRAIKVDIKEVGKVDSAIFSRMTNPLWYYTDDAGEVNIPLIKGSQISIAIENTRLVREFTVPETGDSFDLLDPSLVQDKFGVSYYHIVDSERTGF
uniref:Uncharacterized protein n=1 Tax=Dictyoglomus turgidum TaxID=513050 RepID=A0A7C3SNE5_9BACT